MLKNDGKECSIYLCYTINKHYFSLSIGERWRSNIELRNYFATKLWATTKSTKIKCIVKKPTLQPLVISLLKSIDLMISFKVMVNISSTSLTTFDRKKREKKNCFVKTHISTHTHTHMHICAIANNHKCH